MVHPSTARVGTGRRPDEARALVAPLAIEDAGGVVGEPVWVPTTCTAVPCRCGSAFIGVISDAATSVAEVRRLRGADAAALRAVLVDRMTAAGTEATDAGRRADALVEFAARLAIGTGVRLRDGALASVEDPTRSFRAVTAEVER